jgi:hypothetical protein
MKMLATAFCVLGGGMLFSTTAQGTSTTPERPKFKIPALLLRQHYIAEFNRRFQVKAAQPGSAFVPYRGQDLERIFSLQFERTVNRDNTSAFRT